MVRNNYIDDWRRIDAALTKYAEVTAELPGLSSPELRDALIQQIIDSEQRVLYTDRLLLRDLDPCATDPRLPEFDPLKAAIIHNRAGRFDEAVWLVYMYVHFGKHRRAGWRYIRDTYGAFGSGPTEWWTWNRTAEDPASFRYWLHDHQAEYSKEAGPRGFGNHRKYVSLDALGDRGTGAAVESYVEWVLEPGGDHSERFADLKQVSPERTFDTMYKSLSSVIQFGRIARFDYLTMLAKLKLVDVNPPHSYLIGATGPLSGARLLLRGDPTVGNARELQAELANLGREISVSPDVLEDAICNWQKSPTSYVRFSA